MKKIFSLVILMLLVVSIAAENEAKQFAIKSGHVKYQLSGNSIGTRELWWDNYGMKTKTLEKNTTTTSIFGIKSVEETHQLTIMVKDKFWSIDYINENAQKGDLPYYEESREIAGDLTEEEAKVIAEELLNALGGEILENQDFMGYNCEVIKVLGSKIWVHQGVALKTTSKILGIEINEEAVIFDTNIKISSKTFNPPTDVEYEELSQYMDQGMVEEEYYEDDDDDYSKELSYPYQKFQAKFALPTFGEFKRVNVRNESDQYMASYMKGFGKMMSVVVSPLEIFRGAEEEGHELFTHKKLECVYALMEGGTGAMLSIRCPKQKINVSFITVPTLDKAQILDFFDQLSF